MKKQASLTDYSTNGLLCELIERMFAPDRPDSMDIADAFIMLGDHARNYKARIYSIENTKDEMFVIAQGV